MEGNWGREAQEFGVMEQTGHLARIFTHIPNMQSFVVL